METKQEILKLVENYKQHNPNEQGRLAAITSFIHHFDSNELIKRDNFIGHLTASAFIVNEAKDQLLLLKHRSLSRWLQPGGHIDSNDTSLIAAALREAIEETGLPLQELKPFTDEIFDIDSHPIPANKKKMEPAHVHHDVRFLFVCRKPEAVKYNTTESTGGKWLPVDELLHDPVFAIVAQKIMQVQ